MFLQQGSGNFAESQAEVKSAKSVPKRLLLSGMLSLQHLLTCKQLLNLIISVLFHMQI